MNGGWSRVAGMFVWAGGVCGVTSPICGMVDIKARCTLEVVRIGVVFACVGGEGIVGFVMRRCQ